MELGGLIDFRTLILNDEILVQRLQELLRTETVQVFHHAVIIQDGEL